MPEAGVSATVPPLPPPPRRARWAAVIRWRWPLGLLAAILTVIGLVVTTVFLILGNFGMPFEDWALDGEHATAPAEILEVKPTAMRINNRNALLVSYRFRTGDGSRVQGMSYVPGGNRGEAAADPGRATVQYLPAEPGVNRLLGGHAQLIGLWLPVMGWVLLPAIGLLLWHLRGLYRQRYLLDHGLTAHAQIVKCRRTRFTNPPQLEVGYRFVDRYGNAQEGEHWVDPKSPTGRRLAAGGQLGTAVYLDEDPKRHRLVGPETYQA